MSTLVPFLNHVALLVKSVDRTATILVEHGFHVGPAEEWDGEGTKEIYVERDCGNSLLLMEPAKPGAYQQAMEKRGAGLHHLAIDVENLDRFLGGLNSSGWLLHPRSLETIRQSKTAYLARPGFPALIEVQEQRNGSSNRNFVEKLGLCFPKELTKLLASVGLSEIISSTEEAPWISCSGKKLLISSLCLGTR